MHIRVVIAIILLLGILGSGIGLSLYMDYLCDEILALITESADRIRFSGKDNGAAFERAMENWVNNSPLICSLVIHDQVDVVSQAFFQAKGFLDSQAWDEYLSCLEQLTFLLSMVRSYDKPTIRSIL